MPRPPACEVGVFSLGTWLSLLGTRLSFLIPNSLRLASILAIARHVPDGPQGSSARHMPLRYRQVPGQAALAPLKARGDRTIRRGLARSVRSRMRERAMRLLVVEDEAALAEHAVSRLSAGGFAVDLVGTLADAISAEATFPYNAVVLDRRLPGGDGLGFLQSLRRRCRVMPVIVMSAVRHAPADRVDGLDRGADDHLAKPLDPADLVARVRALLRRPLGGLSLASTIMAMHRGALAQVNRPRGGSVFSLHFRASGEAASVAPRADAARLRSPLGSLG